MSGSFAAYPGAPTHGTLFLEAFGRLSRDADLTGTIVGEEDLSGVFMARANLMSWSADPRSSTAHGTEPRVRQVLWWENEAELTAGTGESRIGWVQVGLETGVEPAMALPALIQCFDDALRRFGVVELSGLQVTCRHLQPGKRSSARDLVSVLYWFNITPEPGADALIAFDDGLLQGRTESELVAGLQRMYTGSFQFGPLVAVPQEQSIGNPVEAPFDVALAPAQWGVSVALPEWTASAAAWVLAIVIDAARASGPDVRNFAVRVTRVR